MGKKISIVLAAIILFSGCGVAIPAMSSKNKLDRLELMESKNQVRTSLGEPDEVRGSIKNVDNDIVTVWQYALYDKSAPLTNFFMGFPTFSLSRRVANLQRVPIGQDYRLRNIPNMDRCMCRMATTKSMKK